MHCTLAISLFVAVNMDGNLLPASKLFPKISMTDSRISGADEPGKWKFQFQFKGVVLWYLEPWVSNYWQFHSILAQGLCMARLLSKEIQIDLKIELKINPLHFDFSLLRSDNFNCSHESNQENLLIFPDHNFTYQRQLKPQRINRTWRWGRLRLGIWL